MCEAKYQVCGCLDNRDILVEAVMSMGRSHTSDPADASHLKSYVGTIAMLLDTSSE